MPPPPPPPPESGSGSVTTNTGAVLQFIAEQEASATPKPKDPPPPQGSGAKPKADPVPDDGPKKLLAAQQAYALQLKQLEDGDLKKVPDVAPPGVGDPHAKVQQARQALATAPQTLPECEEAMLRLEELKKAVAAYLLAEAKALQELAKKLEEARKALEAPLQQFPSSAPKGLEAAHAEVVKAQQAVNFTPATIAAHVDALQKVALLKQALEAYSKAKTRLEKIDAGMKSFGSAGTKLSELTGSNKLSTQQKGILDEALRKLLETGGGDALSEQELKTKAQEIVTKTNQLAETPDLTSEPKFANINDAIAKSPKLKENIVKLRQANWTIKLNTAGGGSYCDKQNNVIAIDPNDALDVALGGLSHETGHALFTPPVVTMGSYTAGWEFVKKATESNFIDEGEAQLVACKTTKELVASGQASKVPADSGVFMTIYDLMVAGTINEDEARKRMAKQFGGLITSTTHESYLIYYGRHHMNTWNTSHASEPAKQLAATDLPSLTLFN